MQNKVDTNGSASADISSNIEELALCVQLAKDNEKANPVKALLYANKGLGIACVEDNKEATIDLYVAKGRAHTLQGDFYEGIKSLSIGLELVQIHFPQDLSRLSAIYNYLGIAYHDKNLQDVALNYFLKALSYNVSEFIPRLCNNLGSVFKSLGKLDKAIHYLNKGVAISQNLKDNYSYVFILDNMGGVYTKKGNYKFANEHFLKALQIIAEDANPNLAFINAAILHSIGTNCLKLKELDKAFNYLKEGIVHCDSHKFYPLKSQLLAVIGEVCLHQKKLDDFIAYQLEGILLAKEQQLYTEEKQCLNNLRNYYHSIKDFEQAYLYSMMVLEIEEKINSDKRDNNFSKVLESREQEIFVLERKNAKIIQQNKELEQFAYVVAHDLKEPLRNINGFAKLLARKYKTNTDSEADEFIGFIERNIHHMHALLNDLLKYTSLEKPTLKKEIVPTQQIVTSILKKFQSRMSKEDVIKIKVAKLPKVVANKMHMDLLFKDLIHNAFKFKEKGKECVVEIGATKNAEGVTFSIKDNGIGIDKAYHEKIFDIFKRLDKNYEGTGIGLALCDKIIRLHGGKLWLESELGKGSCFFFTIPAKGK